MMFCDIAVFFLRIFKQWELCYPNELVRAHRYHAKPLRAFAAQRAKRIENYVFICVCDEKYEPAVFCTGAVDYCIVFIVFLIIFITKT